MTAKIDYENDSFDADKCLNKLVTLLARLAAKEEIEKQQTLNRDKTTKTGG